MARRWSPELEDVLRRTDYEGQLTIDGDEVKATRRRKKRNHPAPQVEVCCEGNVEGQGDLFESYGVSSG